MLRDDLPVILRCCRDWPCHLAEAVYRGGRCGICKKVPEIVIETYPEHLYAHNRISEPDTPQ
jgi:hypothetical protein